MKDSTVSARVESDIKAQAEEILQQIGIPVSVVINSLYRQIIYRKGVPFSLTIPSATKAANELTDAEPDEMLEHSYQQSLAGKGRPLADVFDDLEKGIVQCLHMLLS